MIPEFPSFKELELSDKEEIEKFTDQYPPYSDFNFVSMWSWDVKGEVRISQLHGNLVVRFTDYLTAEPFYSYLGSNKVNETAEALLALSQKEKIISKLQLIPEETARKLNRDKFYILENRNHFDYVYHVHDLHKGEGKKYETHRNLLSRFARRHEGISVQVLSLPQAQEGILELSEKWKMSKSGIHDEEKLKHEFEAIKKIFDFESESLFTVCVFHQNTLIAYSINEALKDNHVLCHFAKADTKFAGIYSFLMKQTCEYILSIGKEFLNYEQDLGLPRLRHSKSAFHPKVFLMKFAVVKS